MIRDYIYIARIDHWFKNVFMLPGVALAMIVIEFSANQIILPVLMGILSTCFVASANYVINEWLDAESDRYHPLKKNRPSARGELRTEFVYIEYALLAAVGLLLACLISGMFLIFSVALLIMGILYNVKPFRTKDVAYLDVLSESINNPLRFLLGWSILIHDVLPPSSMLIAYWMGGAFLMAVKRYAEYKFIDNPEMAGLYRLSFKTYTEEKLLLSSFFYAISASFFLAIFLIKYRIEFLITFPLFSVLFVWYLHIGMSPHSPAQTPEKLYREPLFMTFLLFLTAAIFTLFFVDIPILHTFNEVLKY